MKFSLKEDNNRVMYSRAKKAFMDSGGWIRSLNKKSDFWDLFGKYNNMKVVVKEWHGPYPVVEELAFNSEADYMWFMLRYS